MYAYLPWMAGSRRIAHVCTHMYVSVCMYMYVHVYVCTSAVETEEFSWLENWNSISWPCMNACRFVFMLSVCIHQVYACKHEHVKCCVHTSDMMAVCVYVCTVYTCIYSMYMCTSQRVSMCMLTYYMYVCMHAYTYAWARLRTTGVPMVVAVCMYAWSDTSIYVYPYMHAYIRTNLQQLTYEAIMYETCNI